jgi:signal transduction histidine kinase
MSISTFIDSFIHESRFHEPRVLRKTRIFVGTCLLTSFFSMAYLLLSSYYEFPEGVYLMIFNVIVCLVLPFFARTLIPISWLGNAFLFVGGSTVILITYLTGGLWSSVCLWIIVIPIVALLIVNRLSAIVWGLISLTAMLAFGLRAIVNNEVPESNTELTITYIAVITGLLLIILSISLVFEFTMTKALKEVESKNELLAGKNKTIADQAAELKELIEEKDYIIQILSHDLRNPLANITALVDLTEMEQNHEEQKKYLGLISRAAGNAQNLVSRVLEMDVSHQHDVKTEVCSQNIVEVIEAVMADSQEIASKKNIRLHIYDHTAAKMVLADKTCLAQVFHNLLSNAIKFSPVDTQVQVVLSDSEGSVQVRIIDEGPGINPEEESKLFKKFSKLSTRPTAGESSAGLGLSLVKRYAELTKGKVWYERNAGAGSTFVVEIPRDRG